MPLTEFKTQVLLLHSDQRALDSLGSQFNDHYTVRYATSGSQALSALAEGPINIFISAQDLPGMSGLEALREAKKRSPETLGILLAGNEGEEVEALVGDAEVFQVVHGSVDKESLLELVESASREVRLKTLSESANDTAAHADDAPGQIVMEPDDNGASIISQSNARLRALNPKSFAAAVPIDVLVLTTDEVFLETIRSSTRGRHKLHAARTLAEADEIIRNHKVGVAVVDAAIVRDKIEQLTQYLRREATRLVPVVAGRHDDGEMLMDLINRGKVYRFLLKPVSPGRARLAVEASVKHHIEAPDAAFSTQAGGPALAPEEFQPAATSDTVETVPTTHAAAPQEPGEGAQSEVVSENAPVSPGAGTSADAAPLTKTGSHRLSDMVDAATATVEQRKATDRVLGIRTAIAVVVIGALLWFGLPSDKDLPVSETAEVMPTITAADVIVSAPVVDESVERALQLAETALLDLRLQVAEAALQQVVDADPNNARLPFLTAQLTQAQLRMNLSDTRTAIREGRFEDAADALSAALALDVEDTSEIATLATELDNARSNQQTDDVLALANASLESGDLLTPANSNARYYYELVLANDPENTAAWQGLDIIANRLVLQARGEIDNGNYDLAQELLYDVRAIDSTNSEMIATASALQLARDAAAAEIAATDTAAAEAAAAEEAAAEAAAAEEAAAERESREDDAVETAAELPAAESDLVQPAATIVSTDNADTAETAPTDPVTTQAPSNAVPAAVSSLVRTNYVPPKYPRSAVRRDQSGWVDLAFTVAADGSVKDIGIRGSEPGDLFVAAATRAVEQWQFEPLLENGVVIEKRAAVRIMFSLD